MAEQAGRAGRLGAARRWLLTKTLALTVTSAGLAAMVGLVATAASAATLPVIPRSAEISALVIGIDDYRHVPKLRGAVNDARDVAAALRQAGARDVRVLLDHAADRDTIMATWDDLVAHATPGSTLVLSYAGHGSQAPERVPGSEADGMDEVLILADFDFQGPAVHQKIIDDEIGVMLERAAAFNVVFVADACHSGSMTRRIDPRGEPATVRAVATRAMAFDPLVVPDPAAAALTMGDLGHVSYFGAVGDHEEAPEVTIDDQRRGALSWAFARALEGVADYDGDGITTKRELERFIRETVRMKVQGRQHPTVTRGGLATDPALVRGSGRAVVTPAVLSDHAEAAPLPLQVINLGGRDAAALLKPLSGVTPADGHTVGRFVWDLGNGDVINPVGDVVASVRGGDLEDQLARLQGVIDKWLVLRALERDAERRSLEVRLEPDDEVHHAGDPVTLVIAGNQYPYFTLFNLSADGTINFLYPVERGRIHDSLTISQGIPYKLKLQVTAPFGADHFLAIASDRPLTEFHAALKAIDGKPEGASILALLDKYLTGIPHQMGLHGVYSAK